MTFLSEPDDVGHFDCSIYRHYLTVINVDIASPQENEVFLKGQQITFDGIAQPTVPGMTYQWSVLEGTCNPSTANTENFTTTLNSEGTIKVRFLVSIGSWSWEKTRTIRVAKVVLQKCPTDFLPKGGSEDNTVAIRAFVTPSGTIKGQFLFSLLDVSHDPGYCLNGPASIPGSGEDSDSWNDLQFPAQDGFTLYTASAAVTNAEDLDEAIVTVKSFDYGGFGKIVVQFHSGGYPTVFGKEEGGTNEFTRIPRDNDGNDIADCWAHNSGGKTDDNDTSLNNTHNGDGLSRYQEYRGIDIDHDGAVADSERLDPTKKDLFIRGVGYSGEYPFAYGGAFAEAGIVAHTVDASFCDRETDVMTVTHETGTYQGGSPHIVKRGIRDWTWNTLGSSTTGDSIAYGSPHTYHPTLECLFSDSPYDDANANGQLDSLALAGLEDQNDNGLLDETEGYNENDGPGGDPPPDDGDSQIDGDHVVISGESFDWAQELSALDVDNDGLIDIPPCSYPPPNPADEYSKSQVVQNVITHEMGHAAGRGGHCEDNSCVMVSPATARVAHFCEACRGMLLIHND